MLEHLGRIEDAAISRQAAIGNKDEFFTIPNATSPRDGDGHDCKYTNVDTTEDGQHGRLLEESFRDLATDPKVLSKSRVIMRTNGQRVGSPFV